jgi:predicted nucleic acid-binding protein
MPRRCHRDRTKAAGSSIETKGSLARGRTDSEDPTADRRNGRTHPEGHSARAGAWDSVTRILVALDTSCMVAAVCPWHLQNQPARAAIDEQRDLGRALAIPAPALVETYSVLTRLPSPYRLAPEIAWQLIEENYLRDGEIVALTAEGYHRLVHGAAHGGVAGGRIYDLVIAACVRESRVAAILTLNSKHFDPPPEGVEIIDPCST